MRQSGKWIILLLCVFLLSVSQSACTMEKADDKKLRDVEFTIVNSQDIPEELATQIEEVRADPFQITYGDGGYLYIARGYGTKDTSGYSVEVPECFETSNAICIRSNLLGPSKGEEILKRATCPYVVIKIEYSDKNVIFE